MTVFRLLVAALCALALPLPAGAATPGPAPAANTSQPKPSAAARPAPVTIAIDHQLAELVRQGRIPGQAVTLQAAGQSFLGLYLPASGPSKQGAALLLPDLGAHPDWPGVIASLRRGLPRHGWATLSIQLPEPVSEPSSKPAPAANASPPAAAAASPAPTSGTPTTAKPVPAPATPGKTAPAQTGANLSAAAKPSPLKPVFDAAPARIEAAVAYLRQQGLRNLVIIGDGLGAALAADYLASRGQQAEVQAFVAVSPGNPAFAAPDGDPRLNLPAQLARVTVPVLDIYGERDLPAVLAGARARAEAGRYSPGRAGLVYTQVQIPGAHHSFVDSGPMLLRQIRGWLKRHAAGMEIRPPRP